MGRLIVSQCIPGHSRIGNSLILLQNLLIWQLRTEHSFNFPFPYHAFPRYLSNQSGIPDSFNQSQALLARSLPHCARLCMLEWEAENCAGPYEFPKNELIIKYSKILRTHIAYNYNDSADHRSFIEDLLLEHPEIIVHEPYPWKQHNISEEERIISLNSIAPSSLMSSQVDAWLAERSLKGQDFVSVHARLGDYRLYASGSFYFEPLFYLELCRELCKTCNTRVLLFTNEPSQFSATDDNSFILVDALGDDAQFSLLQRSSMILGPPSTYSSLAAQIGSASNNFDSPPGYVQIRSNSANDIIAKVNEFIGNK
jgi:hypothetical protein